MSRVVDRLAESAVTRAFAGLHRGRLEVHLPDGVRRFGPGGEPSAVLAVRDRRFFRRALTGGEIGLGESYMDGDWSSPDLVALVRLMVANRAAVAALPRVASAAARLRDAVVHSIRDNTRPGSRRNIRAHYDLGNEFFRLFLDERLMYSSAVFASPDDTLEAAQTHKLRTIGRKLRLERRDHVLEIGTGWGGFALFAAREYGCRVTTTTISPEQYREARARIDAQPDLRGLIDLRADDYRDLTGRFDKIVSIEMFEAVGLRHYDDFFGACDRLLSDDGVMFLQTITVDDWRFHEYRSGPSWIAKYIFPGAELASLAAILASLARTTTIGLHQAEQIGTHYARTLHHWRERFLDRLDEVRSQGFDERFIRMWDLYLAFCEGAFLERHIGDAQLVLARAGTRRVLHGEPWAAAAGAGLPAYEDLSR